MNDRAPLSLETLLRRARRALVMGVGGGGDIVGAVPSARMLELHGIETVLGGLSWERFVYDPEPGSRSLDEVVNVEPLAPTAWLASGETRTRSGVPFAESAVASATGAPTLLLDLSLGVEGAVDGLRRAMQALEIDLFVGVDVGGDSLAVGGEPQLRSPLADAMMLATVDALAAGCDALWAVIGYGSDGEVSIAEVDRAIGEIAANDGLLGAWGVTREVAAELDALTTHVRTEASRLVVEAARGRLGSRPIRDGTRSVELVPACTVTFFLDPRVVAARSPLVSAVRRAASLARASDALLALGVPSEYEFEREMRRRGATRYRE